jgi:hypothetical protein
MGQASQHNKQGQLAETALAQGCGEAEFLGNLFERMEETEDGADGGIGGSKMIEIAPESTAESLDASGVPVGEVGESTRLDLALVAERFAEEDGRRGGAVRNSSNVHAYTIIITFVRIKNYYSYYMLTCLWPKSSYVMKNVLLT